MILFCLPYSGGSEAAYYRWRKHLKYPIELFPVKLKGRGKRIKEGFYESLEEAVNDVFENIKDKIIDNDYAIYGHSMGSIIAYELYYKIEQMGMKKPKHIFFSGQKAPSVIREKENIDTFTDYDLIKRLINLGGTQEEVLKSKELLQVLIPIIRNDFRILDNYKYEEKEKKIDCNVSVLKGENDDVELEEILAWKNHVLRGFEVYNFEGNHFFINTNIEKVVSVINNTLVEK